MSPQEPRSLFSEHLKALILEFYSRVESENFQISVEEMKTLYHLRSILSLELENYGEIVESNDTTTFLFSKLTSIGSQAILKRKD